MRLRNTQSPPRLVNGMVLIAVLWIVAALSIAVTGLTRSIRQEAALMSASRSTVQAAAVGEAAIAIVLQQLAVARNPISSLQEVSVNFDQRVIPVQVMPLTGLIDVNAASPELLTQLFVHAANWPAAAAQALAQAIVAARDRKDSQGAPTRFEATEDLLQVPGFGYALYAKVAGLVTTDTRGAGRVNPLAAPSGVLAVLANGDAAAAARIDSERKAGESGIDTTALPGNLVQNVPSRRVRMTARISMPDGSVVEVMRDVDRTLNRRDGAPWQVFHSTNRIQPVQSLP